VFRRPPGGHAEPGDYALKAAQHEPGEKTGQAPASAHLTGMPENSSERDGTARHETIFIFPAASARRGCPQSIRREADHAQNSNQASACQKAHWAR